MNCARAHLYTEPMEIDLLRVVKDLWPFMDDIDINGDDSIVVATPSDERYYQPNPRDRYGRNVFCPATIGGVFMPHVWMTVDIEKDMVITPVTEQVGSVIELISLNGYRIALKGIVFNQDGTFPEAQLEELHRLAERRESLEMDCAYTDLFLLTRENSGQDRVVIQKFTVLENRGVTSARGFEMELVTDHNVQLTAV